MSGTREDPAAEQTRAVRPGPWQRFRRSRTAVAAGCVVTAFALLALVGPALAPYSPVEQDLRSALQGPGRLHLLGTDDLGRDILSRLIHGARVSLGISALSVSIGLVLGSLLGLVAAYYGGWIESIIMRVVDILLALPGILLAIVIVAVLGKGIPNTIAAVAIYAVPTFARLVRGSVLGMLDLDYVSASRAIGSSDARVILRHILPNTLSPIVVQGTLMLGVAILIASGLSFLGLGVQPPNPEWGAMLSKGRELVRSNPIAAIAPGVAITLVVLSFSLLGDGLRDALDPKHRQRR